MVILDGNLRCLTIAFTTLIVEMELYIMNEVTLSCLKKFMLVLTLAVQL